MRVAIVHDWLVTYAGAEKVLEKMIDCYPEADLFSIVDFLPDDDREFLKGKRPITSFIQKLPKAKSNYRNYLPLMPIAIEQFDLGQYDLIISSSHAVAKGVITGPDQLHICYCHSPIRYAWDLQHQYLQESTLTTGLKSWLARYFLHKIRIWDLRTSNNVDYFISNSDYIARRIKKVYRREATTIYPNVAVNDFELATIKDDFYLTASRLVPYKKVDLIVGAFSKMPDKKLVVIGDGPQMKKILEKKTDNIEVLGYQSFSSLRHYMAKAKAFVFAAEEDFGIVPVEAQACGTPVIAYAKGGAKETVVDGITGVLYHNQHENDLIAAVNQFEMIGCLNPAAIREHSLKFSDEIFCKSFKSFVDDKISFFFENKN